MLKFCGMDKYGLIAVVFIFIFVSTNCNASSVFRLRKLVANEQNNGSTTSEVSPTGIPVNESNTNPTNGGKPQQDMQKESQMGNQTTSNMTLPIDPKGSSIHDNGTKTLDALSPPTGEKNDNSSPVDGGNGKANERTPNVSNNGSTVDGGNGKANERTPNVSNNDSCEGSIISCKDQEMLACIQSSGDGGSKSMFLVVKNEGEITLKVTVKAPDHTINDFPAFEVPKNKTRRIDISSTMGKSTELIVNSGNAKCVFPLVKPVSVDNLIHQLSFYSKQVTPIYAVYASFLVALLFGGTWACCRLRKRNLQNGIPYQELEMAVPESSSAVNADPAEGWDDDWDDDWDEDSAVKSPSGHQIRSVSSDGLVSRSSKKDGWGNDWDD